MAPLFTRSLLCCTGHCALVLALASCGGGDEPISLEPHPHVAAVGVSVDGPSAGGAPYDRGTPQDAAPALDTRDGTMATSPLSYGAGSSTGTGNSDPSLDPGFVPPDSFARQAEGADFTSPDNETSTGAPPEGPAT